MLNIGTFSISVNHELKLAEATIFCYHVFMDEKKINEEIKTYTDLAKQNKDIDVAALMMNTLTTHEANILPRKQVRWAYLISVGFPPFGLLFALKFYFSNTDDGKKTAYICIALTALSILVLIITTKMFLSSSGVSPEQLQQIKSQDIEELLQ